ncbi:MAG: PilN domain-containing protein [Candidatus Omnitrophica bacterium]|nr:PilN domain-containing protein [Candidatus Omnitrophota bacterium]
MKRFNLMPRQGRKGQPAPSGAKQSGKPKINAVLVIALIAAVAIAVPNVINRRSGGALANARARLEEAKKELNRRQTQRLQIAKDYDLLVKKKLAAEERLQYLKSAKIDKPGELSQALVYMPTLIPDEIWINKLTVGGQKVVINGSTLDNQAVSKFMDSLNKSKKFKGSSFNFTQKSDLGDATLYNFEIATNLAN